MQPPPRTAVPGAAHHLTQRGNRRWQVFHDHADYALYLDLLAERCRHQQGRKHPGVSLEFKTSLTHSLFPFTRRPAFATVAF